MRFSSAIRIHICRIVLVLVAIGVAPARAQADRYPWEILPDDVFVDVTWTGWTVRLKGTGWLGFISTNARDDLNHTTIEQDLAVDYLNRLATMGFFYMPPEYPAATDSIELTSDGYLKHNRTLLIDGAWVKIRVVVEDTEHTVSIGKPITAAPRELKEWFEDFDGLVVERLF